MVKTASYMRNYRAAKKEQKNKWLTDEQWSNTLDAICDAYLSVNPLYETSLAYRYNCQRVIDAYEMYRLGIECEAQPRTFPMRDDEFDDWSYQHAMKNEEWLSVGSKSRNKTVVNLESQISEWGEGVRGTIEVAWNDYDGPVFNFEV